MPRKISYFSLPAHGHVNATIPMARELVRRGMQVDYYSLDPFRHRIEEVGAVFHDYGPRFRIPQRGPFEGSDTITDFLIEMTRVVLEDCLDSIKALDTSCVMHDCFSPWGAFAAQLLNVPEVTSISSIVFNGQISLKGATGGPDMAATTQRLFFKSPGWKSQLAALRSQFGVTGVQSPYWLMHCLCDLNLVTTSRAFQPFAETFDEERFKFVGLTVSSHPDGPPFPFEALDGRPLLYISLGTVFTGRGPFLRACIEAFRNSRWQVVMSAGDDLGPADLASLPENFLVRPRVPQPDILKRTALFLTHGGANSVSESVWYGAPMLLSPGGGDQFWVADRVAELGAGQNLAGIEVTPEILRQRAEEIWSQPSYAAAAARLGESLRAAGGAARAADEIEAFLLRKAGEKPAGSVEEVVPH